MKKIFFKVAVNGFFADVKSIAADVQDREELFYPDAVLKLPDSYSETGRRTPLILGAHGISGYVRENEYQRQFDRWDGFVDAGYAVFDVNGSRPFDRPYGTGSHMGGPKAVEAYYKAYLYILENYNIDPMLFVAGQSMGGILALNFINAHANICRAAGLLYPVTDLEKQLWTDLDAGHPEYEIRRRIAEEYGFEDRSGQGAFERDKATGWDPVSNRSFPTGEGKVTIFPVPIKIWHGNADTSVDYRRSAGLFEAMKRGGCVAELRTVDKAPHGEGKFGAWRVLYNEECLAYFNRFR